MKDFGSDSFSIKEKVDQVVAQTEQIAKQKLINSDIL